jgi:parallel beta-helix repeat protein
LYVIRDRINFRNVETIRRPHDGGIFSASRMISGGSMRRTIHMHGFMALAMLFVFFAVVVTPAASTDITYSGQKIVISQPGTYVLKNDITNSNQLICIEIQASNVVFDGGGHLIDGLDTEHSAGIYVHGPSTAVTGVTIKNVRMKDWYYGIYLHEAKNSKVEQSSFTSNPFVGTVVYKNAVGNTISGNTFTDNLYGVIFSDGAANGVLSNNKITGNERGLYVYLSDGITVVGNEIANNINNGIQLHTSGGGSLYNNNLNNNLNIFFVGEPFRANAWSVDPTTGPNIMHGPSIGGNFWGNPSGTGFSQVTEDLDADGFADGTLTIAEENVDYHPLVAWTGPTPTPTATTTVTPTATVTSGQQTPYKEHNLPARVEAEDYDLGGEGVAYHDNEASNLGKAYRLTEGVDIEHTSAGNNIGYIRSNEWVEYTVNAVTAGSYQTTFRVAAWATGKTIKVSVDGVETTTVNVPNTGSYTSWKTVTVPIALQAGSHVIRLTFNADKQNLDYFEFAAPTQPSVTVTPTQSGQTPYNGPHAIPGKVEAEDYDNGGQGVAYSDSTPANKGGAGRLDQAVDVESVDGRTNIAWITNNEWTEYTVEVAADGQYTSQFRVGSWSNGKQIAVTVDGTAAGTVNVPNTGGYDAFETASVSLALTAGTHVIRLTYLGEGQNIDWFQVGSVEPTVTPTVDPNETPTVEPTATMTVEPTETGTPSGQTPYKTHTVPVRVEAEDYDNGGADVAFSDSTPENKGMAYRLDEAVDVEDMASGGYNVGYITNGEWVEYTVDVPQSGTYPTTFRVGCWYAGTRQIVVSVDGANKATVTVPITGKDYLYQTVSVPLALDAGSRVIRLTFVGERQNLDYFEIGAGTAQPTQTPTVEPTATVTVEPTRTSEIPGERNIPGRIQAEDYDLGGPNVAYKDSTVANQGGKYRDDQVDIEDSEDSSGTYNVGYITNGEWLRYTVDVAETNQYLAQFRVGSWDASHGSRSITMTIDGGSPIQVSVPLTGSYAAFETVSVPVDLSAGTHTIRLVFNGRYQNLNWFEFVPAN